MKRSAVFRILLVVAGLLIVTAGQAAPAEPPRAELFDTAYMMQVVGSLLLVFGCLFGLVFLLKKLNGVPTGDRKSLRVVGSVKVGAREKILLLDTGENLLLVGVAAGNVRTLYVYEREGVADSLNSTGQSGSAAPNFAAFMPPVAGSGVQS